MKGYSIIMVYTATSSHPTYLQPYQWFLNLNHLHQE